MGQNAYFEGHGWLRCVLAGSAAPGLCRHRVGWLICPTRSVVVLSGLGIKGAAGLKAVGDRCLLADMVVDAGMGSGVIWRYAV